MNPELRAAYTQNLNAAKSSYRAGNHDAAFSHLEIAHVLGQQFLLPHITVHAWMLRVAAKKGRIGARSWARSRGWPPLCPDSLRAGSPWEILAAPMYRHSNPCRFPRRFQVWFQSRI